MSETKGKGEGLPVNGFHRKFLLISGYRTSASLANKILNLASCLFILFLAAPLFIILPIIIKLQDGGPVFYRGERLGKGKTRFFMFKFRTLVPDAQKILGAQLLTKRHNLVTPIGKLLRDTRLDELPQILNVIKGDMDLVGPRPERPEIYEKICRHIPGYDRRFDVKPGVVGYAQLFTPHSSPKRVRTLIDNFYVARKQNVLFDWFFFLFAIYLLISKAVVTLWRYASLGVLRIFVKQSFEEKRELERVQPRDTVIRVELKQKERLIDGLVVDLNEDALLMKCRSAIDGEMTSIRMIRRVRPRGLRRWRRKIAYFHGEVYTCRNPAEEEYYYVLRVEPISPLNFFRFHKYFLRESIS